MTLRFFLVLTVLAYILAAVAAPANTARRETKRSCSTIGDIAIVRSVSSRMMRSCLDLRSQSQKVATTLQSTQFNSALGYYNGNRMWTDAVSHSPLRSTANVEHAGHRFQNTIEDIYNLMSLKNVNTWKGLIYQTRIGQMGRSHLNLWDLYFGGSYDDAGVGSFFNVRGHRECNEGRLQWALLLFIRIRDFIGSGDGNFQNFEVRTDFVIGPRFTQRLSALQTSTSQVYDYVANAWSGDCGGGGERINVLPSCYR